MPNAKITEQVTFSDAIYPRVSAAVSSSTLLDVSQYGRVAVVASHGTATTASTFVISLYESTASTWAGGVATLLSTTTVSVATASINVTTVEAKATDLAEGDRYIGVYITKTDTASSLSAVFVGGNDRYIG